MVQTSVDAPRPLMVSMRDKCFDRPLIGGKGVGLQKLANLGEEVPHFFHVTTEGYEEHVNQTVSNPKQLILQQLDGMSVREFKERKFGCSPDEIRRLVADLPEIDEITIRSFQKLLLDIVDAQIPFLLNSASAASCLLNEAVPLPEDLEKMIRRELEGKDTWYWAVRSSSPQEDSEGDAGAGMHDTLLNQRGWVNVLAAVRRCFGSLFSPRAWNHRDGRYDQTTVQMSVVVMRMVPAEIAGVAFSVEASTANPDRCTLTAVRGLGEGIVQGDLTPQLWEVRKSDFKIIRRVVEPQHRMLVKVNNPKSSHSHPNRWAKVPAELVNEAIFNDEQIVAWARKCVQLEKQRGYQVDLEYAVYDGETYLLQERPVSVQYSAYAGGGKVETAKVIAKGESGSPHTGYGAVRKITIKTQHLLQPGEIMVVRTATPEFGPALSVAGGVITEEGGPTQHGAIIARQRRKPCVVGSRGIMKTLNDGDMVTVEGRSGKIFAEKAEVALDDYRRWTDADSEKTAALIKSGRPARTKVMGIIASLEEALNLTRNYRSNGTGLFRFEHGIEGMPHAMHAYNEGRGDWYVNEMTARFEPIIRAFDPDQEITIRFPDLREFEFAKQEGGRAYSMIKPGPETGPNLDMHIRGVRHYLSFPPATMLYARIIRNLKSIRKINAMAPFCDTVANTVKFRKMLANFGLRDDGTWNFYVMWELASTILQAAEMIRQANVQGGSIGTNDLTMFTGGADRNVPAMRSWFSEMDPSVIRLILMAIEASHAAGIPCGSCGNGPSDYPELGRIMVRAGIDSISVQPDAINTTWGIVFEEEERMGLFVPSAR